MRLPVHQVCKGQPRPAELFIQPDAEILQGDLCGQACLKPAEIMGPFTIQAEGMMELLVYCLHHLAYAREPAPPRLGPRPLTVPPGWADDLGTVGRHPAVWFAWPSKPLSTTDGPTAGAPTLARPGWGWRRRAKKVSASD